MFISRDNDFMPTPLNLGLDYSTLYSIFFLHYLTLKGQNY